MIKKHGKQWQVTTESGRVLGSHPTRAAAVKQLAAVEASKRRESDEMNKRIRRGGR